MESVNISELLLRTAFSCMACDGDIDDREIELIKTLEYEEGLFGLEDIEEELNGLINSINERGKTFLRQYLGDLKQLDLSEKDELQLIKTAVRTIEADEKIEYSEIKFFKLIFSNLNVSKTKVLELYPDMEEYLEEDIMTGSIIDQLTSEYFNTQTIPKFKEISTDN